jgi:phosphoribosylamine--glycine ligase
MQDICKKYNIPTAAYESFTDPDAAKAYIRAQVGW